MRHSLIRFCALFMAISLMTACGTNGGTSVPETAQSSPPASSQNAVVQDSPEQGTSNVLLWINGTYAVLTELNGNDYTLLGGIELTQANQNGTILSLEQAWGVTDRATADTTIDWLLTEGHRVGYAGLMEALDELGAAEMTEDALVAYLNSNYSFTSDDEPVYLARSYSYYRTYGSGAIDGWDYCRAMSLAGWYYTAGYYTEEEAMQKSLEIAEIIQARFSSWDEMMDSYLMGYEYWSSTSSEQRRTVYEEIKARENSPFSLDWNLPLE